MTEAMYKLAAMTSLFISAKVHSTNKLTASNMVALSKGHFRVDQIEKMEMCIVVALSFHLNPPTQSIFLAAAQPLIADACCSAANGDGGAKAPPPRAVEELARYLAELSVCDAYFADKRPSSVACACLRVACEVRSAASPAEVGSELCARGLDRSPRETELCAERLRKVYDLAVTAQSGGDGAEEGTARSRNSSSPTSAALLDG